MTKTNIGVLLVMLLACNCSSSTGTNTGSGGSTGVTGGSTSANGGAPSASGGDVGSGVGGSTSVGPGGSSAGGFTASSGGTPSTATGGSSETSGGAANGGTSGAPSSGGASNGGDAGEPPPAACPATATLAAGDSTQTIQVGSTMRTYLLHIPASYTGKTSVPLVVDFHPFLNFLPGDPGAYQKANSGYEQLSDQEGFIVAWPEGIDSAWNMPNPQGVATCCTEDHTVDDVGFAKALVAKMKQDACVDPKRVYATGYSNGGGITQILACQAADIFAAVAPASFDLITQAAPCTPSRPITEIAFRGLNDPVVPYAGGTPPAPPSSYTLTPVTFLGAEGTFTKWSQLDDCPGSPATAPGNGDWDCQTYPPCKAGVEVTLCSGHTANKSDGHVEGDATLGWTTMKRHTLP